MKAYFFWGIIIFIIFFSQAQETGYLGPIKDSTQYIINPMIRNILDEANSLLGKSYKYGASTDSLMDCSAFTMNVYKNGANIKIPRTSIAQAKVGTESPFYDLQPGDLLFFATNKEKPDKISHVGMVYSVANSEVAFIHASTHRGVCIDTLSKRPWNTQILIARRIIP